MKHLSHSQINKFNTCKKQYKYSYIDNLRPKKTAVYLDHGRLVHRGLEHLWQQGDLQATLDLIKKSIDEIDTNHFNEKEFKEFNFLKTCVISQISVYHDSYYLNDKSLGWKALELEKKYQMPIAHPYLNLEDWDYEYQFIADGVFEDKDGKLWLMEYKTASQLGDNYWLRLQFDSQVTGNLMYLEAIYGKKFEGCKYRVLKKPGIRQKQKETDIEFLSRLEDLFTGQVGDYLIEATLYRTEAEIDEFRHELWDSTQDIKNTVECGGYYKNTSACILRNCQFIGICADVPGSSNDFEVKL